MRVVFDCAARFRETSLNDQLLQGPDLTNNLTGVLLRFRQETVALMADVEKMFHQVKVEPSDCDALRFLWWEEGDLTKRVVDHQMLVHLFGATSSPCCASFALKKTARDNKTGYDVQTIDTVNRNFYVDDCLKSVPMVPEARRLVIQLTDLLAKGGFHLTKWLSNCREVLKSTPASERAPSVKDLDLEDLPLDRALGTQWDVERDTLSFKVAKRLVPDSRRGILSLIPGLYDPLGFAAPFILPAKTLLQDLCRQDYGWDEDVFNLVSVCQHGFLAERSCVTQLVEVLDQIGAKLDRGGQIDIIYLDMSKAFDKVNHAKLLRKLRQYGFGGNLLSWLESYLHNRSQRVTTLGATSSPLPVSSGVPQGSILGPMLFLLYVNSLPDAVRSSQIAAFADDTKVFKEITSKRDAEQLQEDLSDLITWSDSAGLNFNYSKCKAQRITRKLNPVIFDYHMVGSQLEVVSAEKDLGVYITDNLTWNKQVNEQCAKASRLLGYVRRNTRLVKSTTVRRSAYLTLVRSHLGYATQVWTPQSKDLIRKLERVQRRATKYILDLPFICDQTYRDRITKLKLLPISYWHEFLDMIFFFKVVTGIVKVSPSVLPQVLVTRTTRSNSNRNVTHFISKKCNTVTFQRSFFNRTIRIWNTLANDLQLSCNLQISQFKSIMYKYYVDALDHNYDPEDPRSWKTICPSCNVSRNVSVHLRCCFKSSHVASLYLYIYIYIFLKLWDHCNWLTAVVVSLPN